MTAPFQVAILHSAGYTGAELARILIAHPSCRLTAVTSRSNAGQPLWQAHPTLRGYTDLVFSDPAEFDPREVDAVFIAAEHGLAAGIAQDLIARGYSGMIVDLSADFRLQDPDAYQARYGQRHPAPELLPGFVYGLAEVYGPYADGTRYVANPGCFATGLALALWPVAQAMGSVHASVTALTGASGSGVKPSATTHFSTRDGNVRAYRPLDHQHLPEVLQVLGPGSGVDFVPVSGPWTRGIWGTAHVRLPRAQSVETVTHWFESAYAGRDLARLNEGILPELRWSVGTPFCDLGWIVKGDLLVVGFALDNLLKGAASQAVQNLNLLRGRPETEGLLPH